MPANAGKSTSGIMDRLSAITSMNWVARLVVALLMLAPATFAVEPEIDITTRQDEVFVGDSIDLEIQVRNSRNPAPPDMAPLKEQFDVASAGEESRDQSATFIVNGRVSKQEVLLHIYHFRLTPKSAGQITIPELTATIDGKTLTTPSRDIRVIEPEEQDNVIVEVESSHQKVYPTQPFDITARILIKPLPNDDNRNPLMPLRGRAPHVQVNWVDLQPGLSATDKSDWLQPLLAEDGVGFTLNEISARSNSFFETSRPAVFGLFKKRESREGLDGKSYRYFVYELQRTITPDRPGEFAFGPVIVKGTFVAGVERREYTGRRIVAIAPALTVSVHEVPSPRPPTFCGGIGDYQIVASASPTTLRVGDPITLTVEVERGAGSGSLELISAPDLGALDSDFELIDRNPTGRVEGSVKRFAFAMRPKKPNVSIPSIEVSTFDPKTEQFVQKQTAPIMLTVTEASRVTAGDLVGSMPSSPTSSIKSKSEGIFQNITDPGEVRDERVNLVGFGVGVFAIWVLATLITLVVSRYRHKASDASWQRRQTSRRSSRLKLDEARLLLAKGEAKQALSSVRTAIIGFVADQQNRIAEGLTTADIDVIMQQANINEADRRRLLGLLESIESSEYGGFQSVDPAAAIETASSLIAKIGPALERGASS